MLSVLFAVHLVANCATMGVLTRPSSLVTRCRTPLFGEIDQPGYDLEAGLSVIEPYRRKGLAAALLCRAALHLGMTIEMSQSEADGRLKLRAGTPPVDHRTDDPCCPLRAATPRHPLVRH